MPTSAKHGYPDRTCGNGRSMACLPARARTSATLELDRAMRRMRRGSRNSAVPRAISFVIATETEGSSQIG